MINIIYLEDDLNLSETITEFLEDNNFNVTSTYNANDTFSKLYEKNFDILILDVNLPDMNGFEFLEKLRDANITIPTIFTTTLDDMDSLDRGYSLGADDYLRKPFALKELLLRINAILKRKFNTISKIIELPNGVSFDINLNILKKDSQIISLSQKELDLLKLFIQYKNSIVSLEVIYDNLWSASEDISNGSVRTYIKKLRNIFGKEIISNVKRQGYKFAF
jgi:DNA-binding response OmpR family regulator